MSRKTVTVEFLRDKANTFFSSSAPEMNKERVGVAALLEAVLFKTGNYKGFGYQLSEWDEGGLKDNYDDSRRRYF